MRIIKESENSFKDFYYGKYEYGTENGYEVIQREIGKQSNWWTSTIMEYKKIYNIILFLNKII